MKRILFALLLLWTTAPAIAKTVAWWDFEDGMEGAAFYDMEQGGSVDLINDIVMRCEGDVGPDFSSETHSGTGISAHVSTGNYQAGYTTDEALNTWSSLKWTIEISFRMTSSYSSDYKTLIGRDGTSYDGSNAATFYFQRRGSGSGNYALRLSYAIAEGEHVECLSSFIPSREQWYHAALVCDGLQVRMYIDSLDGNGYQLIQSTDLDPSKDNRLFVPNGGQGGSWTFGRGWYDDESTDYCSSYFDDVRFSDEALTPNQFLHADDVIAWNPTPGDGKQNYGTIYNDEAISVVLGWNTGMDPNDPAQVNSEILMHYVYMSQDQNISNDANLYSIADISVSGNTGELTLNDLNYDGLYLWRVDEGINDGSGSTYPKGDPNNLIGKVWQFGSLLSVPVIALQPENHTLEAGQTVVFNVEAQSLSTVHYQWYKSEDMTIDPENDEAIGQESLSGELELMNVTIADEAYYYCQIYNDGGLENACYSDVVRLVILRQVLHLPMDEITNGISPAIVGNYNLTLMNDLLETNLPTLAEGIDDQSGNSILFDNTDSADPNFYGQYAQIDAGVIDYDDITVALWVYWKGGVTYQHIFDFGTSATQYMYITPQSDSDYLHFSIKNEGSSQYLDAPAIEADLWTHIALTIDNSNETGRFYVNGELADTNTSMTYSPGDILATSNNLAGCSWADDPYFNGMIDDVQIFNYALSEMGIARMFIGNSSDRTACIQSLKPETRFDYNEDCVVDLEDFATFASQWLNCAIMPDCIQ